MADTFKQSEHCPAEDLGAYLDGELPAERRDAVERHLAACSGCNSELNFQKKMLLAIEASPIEAGIELPKDFTKRIVTNAESRVDGLRRPKERLNALFICAALFLFSLFALGADAGRTFAIFGVVFDTVGAVAGTATHFALDMGLAAAVILRTLFLNAFSGIAGTGILAAVVFVVAAILFSRFFLRQGRA
jgi:anti-sigma factor RsiW